MAFADLDAVIARAMRAWLPPERLSLSEWMDRRFYLSAESAAEPGKWKCIPYQRGILDAITDPVVSEVTLMKSARVGYTLMICGGIGYHIEHEPASQLVVQPTVDDGKNFSKESIAPMFRDVPCLAAISIRDLEDKGPKNSSNTLTHKVFPGGILSIVGANSGTGFRRISRRIVWFDEIDAYPASAGSEGDQIRLGIMRTQAFWNRKIIAGSTPLTAGASRIAERFEMGDQRRYFVPCPHCGHMAPLVFRETDGRGHWMKWDEGKPETAYFVCRGGGCIIEHKDKRAMVERGEWRADAPFRGHASFHVWAAYSYAPNASWGQLAAEFVEANKGGPEKLKTFVNTILGEVWVEKGDAPEWQRLYQRRESYTGVPNEVLFLTAGVDVQKDRLVYEVVGWGDDRQSWSIEIGVIREDTAGEKVWGELDALLAKTWTRANGSTLAIHKLAIDSGFNTQAVYNWTRRHPASRVLACKGVTSAKTVIDQPTKVDVTVSGRRLARGARVWPVGVDMVKAEFYGWLRLEPPTKESGLPFPPGYCHFPEHGEEFFRQITAEQLVRSVKRTGFVRFEWSLIPGRENHWLDCRVYARAAAHQAGLDRHAASMRTRAAAPVTAPAPALAAGQAAPAVVAPRSAVTPGVGFVHGGRPRNPWLR